MLDDWFKEVERRRTKRSSGKKSTYEAADEVPSMGNQLVDDEQRIPR